jgi:DNA-binding IclR family transcriptional regulator
MNAAGPSPVKKHEAAERILSILNAFAAGAPTLLLTEIAEHTGLYKSTVHRNVQALLQSGYLVRDKDGRFRLGPAVVRLGTSYECAFNVGDHVRPVLQRLVADTRETASFFVREGDQRVCLFRYDSPQPVAHYLRQGAMLPVGKGRTGHVFMAFSGAHGDNYEKVREKGYAAGLGKRVPVSFAVAAPVFSPDGTLAGVVNIPAPRSRYSKAYIRDLIPACVIAAREISRGLGFEPPSNSPSYAGQSFWDKR